MLQTHYIEMPALLSQYSRDAKYTIGKIILPLDQGRWNTVEMKSSAPVLSNDTPVGYHFHTTKIQQFTYKHTRLQIIYILAPIDNAIRIRPSAGMFLGTYAGNWQLKRIEFFFKQKTAYEISRSDWSSDVCSSDLTRFKGLPCYPSTVAMQNTQLAK